MQTFNSSSIEIKGRQYDSGSKLKVRDQGARKGSLSSGRIFWTDIAEVLKTIGLSFEKVLRMDSNFSYNEGKERVIVFLRGATPRSEHTLVDWLISLGEEAIEPQRERLSFNSSSFCNGFSRMKWQ